MRRLEHRANIAYDSILLVDGEEVVGAWTTDRADRVWRDWLNPGSLADWSETNVDSKSPADYGVLVSVRD